MAEYTETEWTRGKRVHVNANRMTVGHVLEFADKLRESGAPLKEQVDAFRAHDTAHFTGMSVRWTETAEQPPHPHTTSLAGIEVRRPVPEILTYPEGIPVRAWDGTLEILTKDGTLEPGAEDLLAGYRKGVAEPMSGEEIERLNGD
jgi:hypothetical protein